MTAMLQRASHGLLIAVAIAVSATAGGRSNAFGQSVRQAPAAARPSRPQPAIDPLTASIAGRVTTADSGAPIRRAEVRAMANSGISRLATTDGDGRFELRDMPAAQYRLTVSKSGFVPLTYGQGRPLETPRVIELKQGQRFTANIALPRGGAIAGRIYDTAGEAVPEVRVQALRPRTSQGQRRLEPIGPVDRTDDTGAFRLYGLPPGDYYVTASVEGRPDAGLMAGGVRPPYPPGDARRMTIFYPGTASLDEAMRVTLGAGGEARADIRIGDMQTAVVAGTVFSSSGAPAADATLTLRSDVIAIGVSAIVSGPPPLMISGHTNDDGTFAIPDVPAGPYTLTATLRPFPNGFTPVRATNGDAGFVDPNTGRVLPVATALMPERAAMPLVVTAAGITGLSLTTATGGVIEGTFVADTGVTQPLPERLEASARSALASDSMMHFGGGSTFRLSGLDGPTYLTVEGLPDEWAIKSIVVDGTDVTDQPIDPAGRTVNARVVLTDRVTILTGKVTDDRSRGTDAAAGHNVIVFAEDAKKWTYPSRHVRAVRTDGDGAFRISGLPGGERYLAVAVDFLEDGEWTDPDLLERLRTGATGFSLDAGERRSVDLRLLRR